MLQKSEKYEILTAIFEVPKDSEIFLMTVLHPKRKEKKTNAMFEESFCSAIF